ncbi:unnamed protein product [Mortierella alpina]
MNSSSPTCKESSTPLTGRLSIVNDRQLQQGLEAIKKGDEYRNRGEFDKAKAKYEKAAKVYPGEAHDRLAILPLCKASMEGGDPERFIPVGWRARAHNAKETIKQVWKHPSPSPTQQQSFFPRPALSTQSTVASLGIADSQSIAMSVSTCMTTSTPASPSTVGTPSTSAELAVCAFGTVSDVRSLTAAYKTADEGARGIIEQQIYDIIKEFGQCQVTFETVQELVVLADIQDRDIFLHLVTEILRVLRDMPLLSDIALQGLAVILDLFPDDIDMGSMQGAFVEMLASLQKRLSGIRTVNNDLQLIPLLSALNTLFDAMVRRGVFGLDREAVYNDLRTRLTGLTSHSNVMVCFQALYAMQALAIIGNDESFPMSVFRRGNQAFVLVGNLSNLATKFDLESVESACKNIKEIFDFSIRDGWYQGLIYADYLVGQRSWWQLEDFVLHSKFQSDVCFQLGVILRLEQIAVIQMDEAVRDGAIKFLTALGENSIPLVPEMVQRTLRRLKVLEGSTGYTKDGVANPKTCLGDLRPVWDPAWLAAPKGILFKAVQERDYRNATMGTIPTQLHAIQQAIQSHHSSVAQPSLEDVNSALKAYYEQDLVILRVSGDVLDLATCYVNLATVEAPAQREMDKQHLKEQATVFHRIPSSEAVRRANMQRPIPLEQLFDKRKLRDGREDTPKTILVQGRAGVGKTTLCKKLVHAHQTGLWKDRFDTVLWLPLRQIRAFKSRTLEGLLREKFFTQGLDQEDGALAHELAVSARQGRVLFVLDGLDEIAKDTRCEDGLALKTFLKTLLAQQHVVITSRPSGVDKSLLPTIDLELETIGFSQQNVWDFLTKVLEPVAVKTVRDFIQRTPLMQGLVNIPVQLDVICFSWDSLPTDGPAITMTGLYQLMVRKLWCKDALRLEKSAEEKLTQEDISRLDPEEIDELMANEMRHLGYLAFRGLTNDHQIEFDENTLLSAFRDLKKYRATVNNRRLPSQLLDMMKQTSFLHTADADLDASKSGSQQAWYFLHLTFQEYFAATWLAQHLRPPTSTGMQDYFSATRSIHDLKQPLPAGMMTVELATTFVQEHKYNPRYEIMWWMVAGLLEGDALKVFFDLLQGAPRDLIGGRHQQILASCLNEARARLDTTVVTALDQDLTKWLNFEIQTCHDGDARSMLGSQSSFPETLLIDNLGLRSSSKVIVVNTLGSRSALSEAAIQSLIGALKEENADVRSSAASALRKQSTLSEAAIQSLIGALKHENADVRSSAASALGKQSTLSEAAIQFLVVALKDENANVSFSAASTLGKQSTLSEAAIQSLIGTLKHENVYVRSSAASALGKQSTLSEAAIQFLIVALKDENANVRYSAVSALGNQSTLSEAAIQSLIGALKDENADVRWIAASALGKQSTLSEAAIQSLIGALKDENANVRYSAVSALGNQSTLSEAAIQSLIGALKDENAHVRYSAASALRKQSTLSEAAIQSLTGALKDENADARSSAASALGRQSALSEAVIQSLIGTLKHENVYVRSSAAEALGKQSTLSEAAIQFLIVALKDENANVRSSAASALGRQSALSEAAIQSLIGALKDENADVRSSAVEVLGYQSTLSEVAIQSLIGALKHENVCVRFSAAEALGKQSTLSEATIQFLIGALKDKSAGVRFSAASALGNQSTLSEATIQSLIGALKDENGDVSSSAASALGKQSTLSEAAIQSLIGALKDENAHVRYSAASALRKQSTLSEAAIQSLIGALKDENADVRWIAASALGKQSTLSEAAIQSLIGALKDENANVRSSAVSALGNQSTLSEAAIQSLIGALKDENADVRSSAASALGRQSALSEAAIQPLIGALKDENADVRSSAASALGRQSALSEAAIQSLIGTLKHENVYVRSSAASALGKQSTLSEAAIQFLVVALKDENANVSFSAASTLGNQSTLSEAAIQSLIGTLKHENVYVRSSAAEALGKQSTLSEAAIQSLIGALKDENADVRSSAASALGNQSTLSEAAIQSLIGALKDENANVRFSAQRALGNQSRLSEAAIQYLIGALKDENGDVSSSAASALGKQSTLSEAAIQSLMGILKDENAGVRTAGMSFLYKYKTAGFAFTQSKV